MHGNNNNNSEINNNNGNTNQVCQNVKEDLYKRKIRMNTTKEANE